MAFCSDANDFSRRFHSGDVAPEVVEGERQIPNLIPSPGHGAQLHALLSNGFGEQYMFCYLQFMGLTEDPDVEGTPVDFNGRVSFGPPSEDDLNHPDASFNEQREDERVAALPPREDGDFQVNRLAFRVCKRSRISLPKTRMNQHPDPNKKVWAYTFYSMVFMTSLLLMLKFEKKLGRMPFIRFCSYHGLIGAIFIDRDRVMKFLADRCDVIFLDSELQFILREDRYNESAISDFISFFSELSARYGVKIFPPLQMNCLLKDKLRQDKMFTRCAADRSSISCCVSASLSSHSLISIQFNVPPPDSRCPAYGCGSPLASEWTRIGRMGSPSSMKR